MNYLDTYIHDMKNSAEVATVRGETHLRVMCEFAYKTAEKYNETVRTGKQTRYAAYNPDGTMRSKTFTDRDELVEYYYGEKLNIVSFDVEV